MSKRADRGFTIAEILIAIGILLVLFSLMLPDFKSSTDASTCTNAANLLYCDMLAQRQRCLSACRETGIEINKWANDGRYQLWEGKVDNVTKYVDLCRVFGRKITVIRICGCPPTGITLKFTPQRNAYDGTWALCRTMVNFESTSSWSEASLVVLSDNCSATIIVNKSGVIRIK
jgi:prepilin-type N-terminal cleavage/methylation domain-containing protein